MPGTHSTGYLKSPKRRYQEHKGHAKTRGVPFNLTFEEWWAIWEESGKYEKRGRRRGQFCMHRIKDEGGYETGNVYIGMNEMNSYASCMTNIHGRAHPDALRETNGKIFTGEPGPDVPF